MSYVFFFPQSFQAYNKLGSSITIVGIVFLIFVLFCVFVLCRSVCCLCVYVYCTTAARWLPGCSLQIYHIILIVHIFVLQWKKNSLLLLLLDTAVHVTVVIKMEEA